MTALAWVVDAVRTPRGKGSRSGALAQQRPVDLVALLLQALAARTGIAPAACDDLLLGCVTQTGDQGANLARIAALYAGWDPRVSGATINRFCASGLDAIVTGAARIAAGVDTVVVAGGVESMSRVPMFSDRGAWFSDPEVARSTGFVHMGVAADLLATLHGLGRDELDATAVASHRRAAVAWAERRFDRSIVPVLGPDGAPRLDRDELVRPGATVEDFSRFDPAFAEAGAGGADDLALSRYPEIGRVRHLHHVGSSPALADGAGLALLASAPACEAHGVRPRAKVLAAASVAVEPVLMLSGNVACTRQALQRAGLSVGDVDVFEVNESFAAVPIAFARELGVDPERLNPNGGAIALGHPLGATGAMLLSTLVDELERRDRELGVVSICGGAGVATAVVVGRA